MKKLLLTITLLLASQFTLLFAASAQYQDENYTLNVVYNDSIVPGDAVAVRMTIITPKNHKKTKAEPEKKGLLQLYQDKKIIEKAAFYNIGKKRNTQNTELLCLLPVSAWLKDGNYSLKVIFSLGDSPNKEFSLPVTFKAKTFNSETIELDEKNTAIKTDNSPERAAQIEKLNDILYTTIPTDIYQLKQFMSPTTSARYTSYYGDRRVYAYTNGKTSTDMHNGNDYGIPEGSEVRACAEGRVVMAENRISTGWSIVVEHLPGLYSLYYHLSEMNVKEGDYVKMGELIGKSGSTGLATGPHLHWEMRLNASPIRPEFFIQDFAFEESN